MQVLSSNLQGLVDVLSGHAVSSVEDLVSVLEKLKIEVKEGLKSASSENADLFRRLFEALEKLPQDWSPSLQADVIVDVSQYFYVSGIPFEAINILARGEYLARQGGDQQVLFRVLNLQGVFLADTGDSAKAIEKYSAALEIAKNSKEAGLESRVLLNLGVALIYISEFDMAIQCFNQVIEISKGNPELLLNRLSAFTNIALCCIQIEDYSRGLPPALQAVEESPEPVNAVQMLSRVLREKNLARILMEVHSLEAAKAHVEAAKRYAALSKSPRADLEASIADGLFLVHSGQDELGLLRLNQALEKARVLKSALRDVLLALVKANEIIGDHQTALSFMKEIVSDTQRAKERSVLKHLSAQALLVKANHPKLGGSTHRLQMHHDALEGKVAKEELFKYQAEQKRVLKQQREEIDQARLEMLERMAVTAELRDDSTGEHSYRVGKLSSLLAAANGESEDILRVIDLAGRLHDIGKIGIPDAILLKPGKLNDVEREIMKSHAPIGAELLSKSHVHQVRVAEEIARYHHEWWDGSGYPEGLSGTDIPLAARIAALADVFDALTHKRPYKEAWPAAEALREIMSLRGKQFDPQLTDLFVALVASLLHEHPDLDTYLSTAALKSEFLQARKKIREVLATGQEERNSDSRLDIQR